MQRVLGEAPSAALAVRKCSTAVPSVSDPAAKLSAHLFRARGSGAHLSGESGAHYTVAVLLRRFATQAKDTTSAPREAATTTPCGLGARLAGAEGFEPSIS